MEKEDFRKRIYDCLEFCNKEIRWQIDNAIDNGVYKECDESIAGYYGDVKAILFAVLEKAAERTVATPCTESSVRRFNRMRKLFKWQVFH